KSNDSKPELFPPPVSPKSNNPTISLSDHSEGTKTLDDSHTYKSRPSQRLPILTTSPFFSFGGYVPTFPSSSIRNDHSSSLILSLYLYCDISLIRVFILSSVKYICKSIFSYACSCF